jgi:hypothetical protein
MITADADDRRPARADLARLRLVSSLPRTKAARPVLAHPAAAGPR